MYHCHYLASNYLYGDHNHRYRFRHFFHHYRRRHRNHLHYHHCRCVIRALSRQSSYIPSMACYKKPHIITSFNLNCNIILYLNMHGVAMLFLTLILILTLNWRFKMAPQTSPYSLAKAFKLTY